MCVKFTVSCGSLSKLAKNNACLCTVPSAKNNFVKYFEYRPILSSSIKTIDPIGNPPPKN